MATVTITLNDQTDEEYKVDVVYDYTEEESYKPLPSSIVASIIIRYLISTGKLNDYYDEAFSNLGIKDDQVQVSE